MPTRSCVTTRDGLHVLHGSSFEELVGIYAREHRLTPEDSKAEIAQRWYLISIPEKPRSFLATVDHLISGAKAMVGDLVGNVVDPIEAHRRADICSRCPWASNAVAECTTCGLAATLQNAIGRQPVASTVGLGCGVCGCSCAVLVWAKPDKFNRDAKQHPSRPDTCWITEIR